MEQLAFTALLNRLFGPQVLALLQALHIHPKHPATPITNPFAMELLVVAAADYIFHRRALAAFGGASRRIAAHHGSIHGFVDDMADEVSDIIRRSMCRTWSRSACSF